jgi:hypothetical protein
MQIMLSSIVRHLFDRFVETQRSHGWQAAVGLVFRATLLFALASVAYIAVIVCCYGLSNSPTVFPLKPRPKPSELPDRRSDYHEFSVSPQDSLEEKCLTEWHSSEYWTRDPREVGLCFAGYPNIDGIDPDIIKVFRPEPGKAIVVVISMGCLDDSIEAKKIRVDLAQDGEAWVVEWAGGQWRCHWGRGQWFWAPTFCV